MGELTPIKNISMGVALTDKSDMTVGKTREPKPCQVCGVPQEPRVIKELDLIIDRPSVCEECRNKQKAEKQRQEEEFRRQNIEPQLLICGVPPEFTKYSFTTGKSGAITWSGKSKATVETCIGFAQEPEGCLLLMGKTGRGKTHLAISILREVVVKGMRARFVSCLDLINSLRAVYRARNDDDEDASEQEVLNRIGRGLLVLDDLGATRVTPMVRDALTLIVDRCERRGQPLIVTTNLSAADIGTQIDERLASRLVGMCKTPERVILLEGVDHRLKGKK